MYILYRNHIIVKYFFSFIDPTDWNRPHWSSASNCYDRSDKCLSSTVPISLSTTFGHPFVGHSIFTLNHSFVRISHFSRHCSRIRNAHGFLNQINKVRIIRDHIPQRSKNESKTSRGLCPGIFIKGQSFRRPKKSIKIFSVFTVFHVPILYKTLSNPHIFLELSTELYRN